MPELITEQVRAKSIYMDQQRVDKMGRTHTVRNHIVPDVGTLSGKEAEKIAIDMATELGVDESRMHVETYAKGKAPVSANPRHRGTGHHWNRKRDGYTEVTPARPFQRVRTAFAGCDLPTNDEERAALVAAFEARKAALLALPSKFS